MKPRFLAILAALASLGFGWWLISQPHSSRELFLAMVAWVLGFWVASGIRRDPRTVEDEEEWEEEEAD